MIDQKKIAYSEKVNKKLKDPQKTIMLQLMELGYTDYDKNLKVIKKEKKPDIGTLLDKIVTAYNKKWVAQQVTCNQISRRMSYITRKTNEK